ncbi:hypothetical protein GCM10023214_07960 [Amycolatopsis dongchuanensis]|uniref:Uncharacterized protein n=1 Tax=Amycolatopsis dongchuanensis TaxID=1070866 RepID=A0ABP9Q230_9PSEU
MPRVFPWCDREGGPERAGSPGANDRPPAVAGREAIAESRGRTRGAGSEFVLATDIRCAPERAAIVELRQNTL